METQSTASAEGSRLLFSRYKNGADRSWSLRWKLAKPRKRNDGTMLTNVTLCRSQKDAPVVTHDVMEELFEDQRVEAILADIMRRRGEP